MGVAVVRIWSGKCPDLDVANVRIWSGKCPDFGGKWYKSGGGKWPPGKKHTIESALFTLSTFSVFIPVEPTAVSRGLFDAWSVSTQNLQCIVNVNFDLANSFYGKCCSSKTISARRSADGYKSPQRDALRFIFCRRRRLFVAFSEREPFLRGFLCGKCGKFLPQMCIWVSRKCAKSFVRFRPSVWICDASQIYDFHSVHASR